MVALHRYPVKSMAGETLTHCYVGGRGLLGDRAFAVVDTDTGRVASAKHPRKWGPLLEILAEYATPPRPDAPLPPVRLSFSDGTTASTDDPEIDQVLSRYLGRPVRLASVPPVGARIERVAMEVAGPGGEPVSDGSLAAAAPGTFFDHSPVHLLTTATLAALADPADRPAAARFRPNVLIELAAATTAGFAENGWVGRRLHVGAEVVLDITTVVPRCAIPTLAQRDLPPAPGLLRVVGTRNSVTVPGLGTRPCAGSYAQVLRAGTIWRGDPVTMPPDPH